ncbi:hypothetical protein D9M71_810710 [compost metagenome]
MHVADAFTDLPHALLEQTLDVRAIAPGVSLDRDMRGNSVADTVGDELGAGDHSR